MGVTVLMPHKDRSKGKHMSIYLWDTTLGLYIEYKKIRKNEMDKRFSYQSEGEKLSLSVRWWLMLFAAILLMWIGK